MNRQKIEIAQDISQFSKYGMPEQFKNSTKMIFALLSVLKNE